MGAGAHDEGEEREFAFTDSDYQAIRKLLEQRAGIHLSNAKRDLAYGRMARIVRRRGLSKIGDYLQLVRTGDAEVLTEFVNALTTNVTRFFREPVHFDFLTNEYVPELLVRNRATRVIRFWSAACSTGEEPYSIAMTLKESVPRGWHVRILATDLDSNVLETAKAGIYAEDRVEDIGPLRRRRWFSRRDGRYSGPFQASPELQAPIEFRQLNLMEEWPLRGPIDAIFCRNVLIYFTRETQRKLFDRFADLLRTGGCLFLGHSESLLGATDRFEFCGRNIYRKIR